MHRQDLGITYRPQSCGIKITEVGIDTKLTTQKTCPKITNPHQISLKERLERIKQGGKRRGIDNRRLKALKTSLGKRNKICSLGVNLASFPKISMVLKP